MLFSCSRRFLSHKICILSNELLIDMYTIKNSSKSEQTTVEHGGNGGAAQS